MSEQINGSFFETESDDSIETKLKDKKVTVEFKGVNEQSVRKVCGQITGFFGYQHDDSKINSIAGFTLTPVSTDIAFSDDIIIYIHD